jgi:hypothetical protein
MGMLRVGLILFLGLAILSLNTPFVLSQEEKTEWVWGEVLSVDKDKNEIKVKYLDYETDEEKEITITCDAETKFENVSSISEIKVGDSVSIDYTVKEEKNIAKNISVERAESPIEEQQTEP